MRLCSKQRSSIADFYRVLSRFLHTFSRAFTFLGEDFFPQVDAGLLRLHVRARAGLRVEETARFAMKSRLFCAKTSRADQLQTILDNIGLSKLRHQSVLQFASERSAAAMPKF